MKILVLGGTGAIGVDLVQILADRGLSLARMKMEMIFLRLSSAGSIPLNGNREMSLIIRLMMRRTVICTRSIRKWQMHKRR